MQTVFRHNLGDRVKDLVTGFSGIVTSRSEHLFGCSRYWVEPEQLHDGKPIDGRWFDEESIEVVNPGVFKAQRYRVVEAQDEHPKPMRRAGGPTNQPASSTRQSER